MEVLTIFAKKTIVIEAFKEFICHYPKLYVDFEDADTAYFVNPKTERNEIYYHSTVHGMDEEFFRDYSEEEQIAIKQYFHNEEFRFIDIQFRDENFLRMLLEDFKVFVQEKYGSVENEILLGHPHNGFIKFADNKPLP